MSFVNTSPWIHQLDKERKTRILRQDLDSDVAIVGAGIAGVSTAFFLLEHTDKKIVLLEGGKLAHGATGHNAGQITSYFERSLHDIAEEFGLEKTKEAQVAVESAWELLDHMYTTAGLDIPVARFVGHAGIVGFDRIIRHLKDDQTREKAGLQREEFWVANNAPFLHEIPKEYSHLYTVVSQKDILERLESKDSRFFACISSPKGCLNSALFCQEVVAYLLNSFSDRFSFFEHTHIGKVVLKKDGAILDASNHIVKAKKVVLCTNGFETMKIFNESGLDIDTAFHHRIGGIVGFMSGYLKKYNKPPTAISYITNNESPMEGDYYYLTRRQYEYGEDRDLNLISVGGPELKLDNTSEYLSDRDYPEEAQSLIDRFIRDVFEKDENKDINYVFKWHGLMGYTPNSIRLIGSEPKNPTLLYNLGCNGIGILPSIYGGKRISQIIAGEKLTPSIFDPQLPKEEVFRDPKGENQSLPPSQSRYPKVHQLRVWRG